MNWLVRGLRSSVGRKMVVALTGAALLLFVLAHMLGNLQLFAGREALNSYAEKLQGLGPLLWVARGGLLLVVALHIVLALQLALENRRARPERYAHAGRLQSTPGARSMVITGLTIVLFVAYHLAHFTLGYTNPEHHAMVDAAGRPDVYGQVVAGFSIPLVSGLYVAAMALLCLHLSHGFQSLFQSLGVSHPAIVPALRGTGIALAWLIFLGNASMPLAVLAGLVPLHPGG